MARVHVQGYQIKHHIISTLRHLLSSIYNNVLICLMNLNLVEQVGWEHLHHVVPDVNSHVLSCANGPRQMEK